MSEREIINDIVNERRQNFFLNNTVNMYKHR